MRLIEFKSGGSTLRGDLYEPNTPRPHPAIIFAHGLLSTRAEFGAYPKKFCDRGYLVLAFDFRGHGASEGARGLVSEARLVEDLQHALDYIEANPGIDNNRLALFGHSLGGGAVLCATARDPRVRAVIAGATVGRLRDEIGASELKLYRAVMALNNWQKQLTKKSIYVPYRVTYKDIFNDPQARRRAEREGFLQTQISADSIPHLLAQDAFACAEKIRVPALIVQGELDRVVKPASTRKVFDTLTCEKEWYVVKEAGHSFATEPSGAEAFEFIAAWLDRQIKQAEDGKQ